MTCRIDKLETHPPVHFFHPLLGAAQTRLRCSRSAPCTVVVYRHALAMMCRTTCRPLSLPVPLHPFKAGMQCIYLSRCRGAALFARPRPFGANGRWYCSKTVKQEQRGGKRYCCCFLAVSMEQHPFRVAILRLIYQKFVVVASLQRSGA